MKPTDIGKSIDRSELKKAMATFEKRGGKIKVLQPQEAKDVHYCGGYNWGPYESPLEMSLFDIGNDTIATISATS